MAYNVNAKSVKNKGDNTMKKTIIFLLAVLMLGMVSCADSKNDSSEDAPSEIIDGIDRTYSILRGEIVKVESDTDFTIKVSYSGKNSTQYIDDEVRIVIDDAFKDFECFDIDEPKIGMNVEVKYTWQVFHDEDDELMVRFDKVFQLVDSDGGMGEYNTYIRYI